ncbi:4-hydroxy-tetrahydrodipicolinate synthase [candidate division KSB1 bacterium]|nr:4-hydroxy-tetrahydrodipicolinate synthase [candidate division KSB1 bacterium]
MNPEKFRGTTVALVTPFHKDGSINVETLKELIDWQIEQGTDVILAGGTTGESATLSHDEHHILMDITVEHVDGRVPVLCGTGSNSTEEAKSLTAYAKKAGADAALVVTPYYNKPTQYGLYLHYKTIAESTDLPLILYNVPGRTACNLDAQTTVKLAAMENIMGIKEASGDLAQIMYILNNRPNKFLVLSGDDAITLALLALGGDGVVSVVANQAPALLHDMVHTALKGEFTRARDLFYRLLPLMELNFVETNPSPVKTALAIMGKIEDNFRLPLTPLTAENAEKMQKVLVDLGLVKKKG